VKYRTSWRRGGPYLTCTKSLHPKASRTPKALSKGAKHARSAGTLYR
jgi:hypothetical protein